MSNLRRSQRVSSRPPVSYKDHDSSSDDNKLPPIAEPIDPSYRASRKRSRTSISSERIASEEPSSIASPAAVARTTSQPPSSPAISGSFPDSEVRQHSEELRFPLSPGSLARILQSTNFTGQGRSDQTPSTREQTMLVTMTMDAGLKVRIYEWRKLKLFLFTGSSDQTANVGAAA
ncbi:hypothetical protein N7466_010675 [Penicillium verhagenii]|uniref:uncharacterized protein n=1 Tax=Penicillium verhagenii TaxID=1562060 RepID=UPI002544E92B|nr:uncharacterized protein N7466_010675 [Penicillium verhagenii]KAJ5917121.1 hypothetical protein N7466_010675 [Penicillium verhagenii]